MLDAAGALGAAGVLLEVESLEVVDELDDESADPVESVLAVVDAVEVDLPRLSVL